MPLCGGLIKTEAFKAFRDFFDIISPIYKFQDYFIGGMKMSMGIIPPIKLAIIGMGRMGKYHYQLLKNMESVEIVALCDTMLNEKFSHPTYTNIDKMLSSVDIEVAIIAVPTSLHKEVALKCIKRQIHLFIEKPIASTIEDAQTLLYHSHQENIKVVVGYIERFNPVVQRLRDILKSSQIYSIQITRVSPFPSRVFDVGVLIDLSVHDIDLLTFISRKKIMYKKIFTSKNQNKNYEDMALLAFQLEGGMIASITNSWLSPMAKRVLSVTSDCGYYEADLMTQELIKFKDNEKEKLCCIEKINPLYHELIAFIDYIKTGENKICATIEESINTLNVISSK